MSSLLEDIAKQSTLSFARFSQAYEDESRAIQTTLSPQSRAQKATDAARFLARFIPSNIDSLEAWVKEVEITLRQGLNKNTFRALIESGVGFLKACQELIETANKACREAELLGESPEAKEAQDIIAATSIRLSESESKVLYWKKIVDRQPPEIDPALIERGAEQIRKGQFKTGEQILEEIHNRNSSK